MTLAFKGWETAIAVVSGLGAGILMRADFYAEAVAEIVTVLGFLIAALVPAMVLAATALRAGNFSVKTIRSLSSAIDRQIALFGGLFLYTLVTCGVAVTGKLLKWRGPEIEITWPTVASFSFSHFYPAVLTFLLVLLFLRSIGFVSGVRSILRLSSTIAEDEARLRDQTRELGADELAKYEMPAGYGDKLQLPG